MLLKRFSLVIVFVIGFAYFHATVKILRAVCPPFYALSGESTGDRFGLSVAGAGDVNGDGFADILVGAPFNAAGGSYAGRVYVYSGADGSILYTKTGAAAGDNFGIAIAGVGDANDDGYSDFIVGADSHDAVASDAGRAYLFSGLDGALLFVFDGEGDNDWFGKSVSGAGDVNGDGYDDAIVGAPQYGSPASGCAYVFSGQDGTLLHKFISSSLYNYLGTAVAAAGDVDGDGFADLIVGAPVADGFIGEAYVFSGQTGSLLYTLASGNPDGQFGQAVAGAGDVDADGYSDVIVGAWTDKTQGDQAGRAFVYSGHTGTLLYELTHPDNPPYTWLAVAVAGVGDINDDGHADVLIGRSGSALIFSGQDGLPLKTIDGLPTSTFFGTAVSSVGDVDGDGQADIIIGQFDLDEGRAYVYSCDCVCNCGVVGDVTGDGNIDPLDVSFLVNKVFKNHDALCDYPDCPYPNGDVDCDLATSPLDVSYLVNKVFKSRDALCDGCSP